MAASAVGAKLDEMHEKWDELHSEKSRNDHKLRGEMNSMNYPMRHAATILWRRTRCGDKTRRWNGPGSVESVVSSHRGMARSCGDALTGEVWRDRSGSECSSLPSTPPHSCWQPRVAPLYINQLMFCTINQLIRPRGVCVSCRVFPAQVARSDLENQ